MVQLLYTGGPLGGLGLVFKGLGVVGVYVGTLEIYSIGGGD